MVVWDGRVVADRAPTRPETPRRRRLRRQSSCPYGSALPGFRLLDVDSSDQRREGRLGGQIQGKEFSGTPLAQTAFRGGVVDHRGGIRRIPPDAMQRLSPEEGSQQVFDLLCSVGVLRGQPDSSDTHPANRRGHRQRLADRGQDMAADQQRVEVVAFPLGELGQ